MFQLAPAVDAYNLIRHGQVDNVRVSIGRNSPMVGLFSVHRLKLLEVRRPGFVARSPWFACLPAPEPCRVPCVLRGFASAVDFVFRWFQALLESIPQAVLQIYVGMTEHFSLPLLVSVFLSWLSLSTSLVLSDRREVKYHALALLKIAVKVPWCVFRVAACALCHVSSPSYHAALWRLHCSFAVRGVFLARAGFHLQVHPRSDGDGYI